MKVLIAIDGSECSSAAVNAVVQRAWGKTVEFRIITAVEPLFVNYPVGLVYVEPMQNAQSELNRYCLELVDEKVKYLQRAFPQVSVTGTVLHGDIVDSIVDEAERWQADLLIVGSHGRKGLERFFLGSVAERVAHRCQCSIEIVKDKTAREKAKQQAKTGEQKSYAEATSA